MPEIIRIPVKVVNNEKWAQLNLFGNTHVICGERFKPKKENYTFAGGHRVRLFTVKNNVHWRIPSGIQLDIREVAPANQPRRQVNR